MCRLVLTIQTPHTNSHTNPKLNHKSCILLLLMLLQSLYLLYTIRSLTDCGACRTGDCVARYLGDRQQEVANQQTGNVVSLAAPMQHMVARGQNERRGQCGGEEHHRNE